VRAMNNTELIRLTNLDIVTNSASIEWWGINRGKSDCLYEAGFCLKGSIQFCNAFKSSWDDINKQLTPHRLRKKKVRVLLSDGCLFRRQTYVDFTSSDYDKWLEFFDKKGPFILKYHNLLRPHPFQFNTIPFAKHMRVLAQMNKRLVRN